MSRSLRNSVFHPGIIGMLIGSLSFGWLGGCATIRFAEYPDVPINQLEYSATRSGLTVGIDPLSTRAEAMKYFKVDLPKKNILAVYVELVNNRSSTVLFENSQCSLIGYHKGADGESLRSDGPGGAVAVVGAAFLSLPLMFIGMKMISDADHIKRNFAVKELKRQGISPGRSAAGFVYFQQADDTEEHLDSWMIRVSPTELDGTPLEIFEFTIDTENK
jgi:hypothetical protein